MGQRRRLDRGGYVRRSRPRWESLDEQRDRIRVYCKTHAIALIDINASGGIYDSNPD